MTYEQRTAPRRAFYAPVAVQVPGMGGRFFLDGVNLSEGGMFLGSDLFPDLGEHFEIQFHLGNDQTPVTCEGQVRWVLHHPRAEGELPPGMGLWFSRISEWDRHRLREFIYAA